MCLSLRQGYLVRKKRKRSKKTTFFEKRIFLASFYATTDPIDLKIYEYMNPNAVNPNITNNARYAMTAKPYKNNS